MKFKFAKVGAPGDLHAGYKAGGRHKNDWHFRYPSILHIEYNGESGSIIHREQAANPHKSRHRIGRFDRVRRNARTMSCTRDTEIASSKGKLMDGNRVYTGGCYPDLGDFRLIRFVHGQNYLWLFCVILLLMPVSAIVCYIGSGRPFIGSIMLPIAVAYIQLCQWNSGVALDSKWTASHTKGTWQFTLSLTCGCFVTILFSIMTTVGIITVGMKPL